MSQSKRQFLRPSPPPPNKRTVNNHINTGHHNNIVAYELLIELGTVTQIPEYWRSLSPTLQGEITQVRSLAFEGCYPDNVDCNRITQAIENGCSDAIKGHLMSIMETMRGFIAKQEYLWSQHRDMYPSEDLLQNQQDNITAFHYLPDISGGRILTFGSARAQTGSPSFDAARWLNETLIAGMVQEDGTSEGVITGAGPGIMKAANYGAMQGRWKIIQQLLRKLENAEAEEKSDIESAITNARLQMHSIGIRIALPFEASWNEHLQLGLTIKNFAPRKGGLVSTATGRSISYNGGKEKHSEKHPAIFAFEGGFGTMDELWEVACLIQCGKMPEIPLFVVGKKPSAIIDHSLNEMRNLQVINPDDQDIIIRCDDEKEAVKAYLQYYSIEPSAYITHQLSQRSATANNENTNGTNGYRQ